MTRKNNYVRAAENEPNIECSVFHDTDKSSRDFKENFKILQHSGYRTFSVLYYIDNGNVADDIKFSVKGSKADKVKYLSEQTNFDAEEIQTWDNDTLDSEILGYESDVNLINYALDKMPDTPEGLEFVPNKNLICLGSSGYSQGDYSTVIYCPEDLEKAWGNYPKQESIQKMINHYLWDSPVYALFEIDGKEYNIWDMPKYDEYDFDREKFLAWVAKESGVDIEKLKPLCPEYPGYN